MLRSDGNLTSHFKQVKDKTLGGEGNSILLHLKSFSFLIAPPATIMKQWRILKAHFRSIRLLQKKTNHFSFFCYIQMKWSSSLHWMRNCIHILNGAYYSQSLFTSSAHIKYYLLHRNILQSQEVWATLTWIISIFPCNW